MCNQGFSSPGNSMKGEEEKSVVGRGIGVCKGPVAGEQVEMIEGQEGRRVTRAQNVKPDSWGVKAAGQMFTFVPKAVGTTDRS